MVKNKFFSAVLLTLFVVSVMSISKVLACPPCPAGVIQIGCTENGEPICVSQYPGDNLDQDTDSDDNPPPRNPKQPKKEESFWDDVKFWASYFESYFE